MTPIAITTGEPAGIGPDLIIQLAHQSLPCAITAIGDRHLLQQRARTLGLPLTIHSFCHSSITSNPHTDHRPGELHVDHIATNTTVTCGQLDTQHAPYVINTLTQAVQGCLTQRYRALVTAPVHKAILNQAGTPFSGHTEWLASTCGATCKPIMLFVTPTLKLALATTHLPLAQVSATLNTPDLLTLLQRLHTDLPRLFAINHPRILVAGLNPHAGEQGYLGDEEQRIIQPALHQAQQQGIAASGPYAADTLFTPYCLQHADVVVAMYHDQGLPALKQASFGQAVNITLGLPFIRTSVDHGVALERAGSRQADPQSLRAALQLAHQLSLSNPPPCPN